MIQGSMQDMIVVANNCPGYDNKESAVVSLGMSKSCKNCKHLENSQCNKNLYDKVLAGARC